jgi:cholesterol transport system auxiliary component
LAAVTVLALALAGCSGGLGGLVTKSPGTAYDLTAANSFSRPVGRGRGQLVIAEPSALGPLESDRILVRPAPGELAQLGDAQWEERLPRLVQARLVESFQNARRMRVGRPSDKIATDFALLTDLRVFEVSAADGTAQVEIAAKIVNERSGRIVAARVLRATVPAQATQGAGAVAAINEAFGQVATELVLWVAKVV